MSRQEESKEQYYPRFDRGLGQWVATSLAGAEVYGRTEQECWDRLMEHNDVYIDHWFKSPEDRAFAKTAVAESLDDARGLPLPFTDED